MKPEQQICLVHVGKAGGSTLGCMLGFSLHCDDNTAAAADANSTIAEENDGGGGGGEEENDKTKTSQLQLKGLLPIATTHVFHRGVNDCADVAACEYVVQ